MKVAYLSPHFPANQHMYCARLRDEGCSVLGLGDAAWEEMRPEQQRSLSDYQRVPRMDEYDEVYRAVARFIARHGRIDRVESHNEHWLLTDARLREDYRIRGRLPADLSFGQRKSLMKERFVEAGVPVGRGIRATTLEAAREFVAETGYPLVAKPDIGVGASATWRIEDADGLERFFEHLGPREYFLEEFLRGVIVTYDGLADREGRIVRQGSLEYSNGVMEVVNGDLDIYYYTHRRIPRALVELGERVVASFGVREEFFHIEFFRLADGSYRGLEANLRPPGGFSIDMYNYAMEADLYHDWARVMTGAECGLLGGAPYHCAYVGRKDNLRYRHTHASILNRMGDSVMLHTPMPGVFRNAMGDYGYLIRFPDLEELKAAAHYIQEKS
jgi:hypothetical protein